jgi:regulator of replication initiation timing
MSQRDEIIDLMNEVSELRVENEGLRKRLKEIYESKVRLYAALQEIADPRRTWGDVMRIARKALES